MSHRTFANRLVRRPTISSGGEKEEENEDEGRKRSWERVFDGCSSSTGYSITKANNVPNWLNKGEGVPTKAGTVGGGEGLFLPLRAPGNPRLQILARGRWTNQRGCRVMDLSLYSRFNFGPRTGHCRARNHQFN